jgi:hypothetical protein
MVNFKKATLLLLAGLLCLFFVCGCSFSGSGDINLRYPERSERESAVYKFLEEYTSNNYALAYASRGNYLNPIIFRDLNGDGSIEAVVSYVPVVASGKTVKTLVLREEKNGDFALMGVVAGLSDSLDKIEFGDMTGDGVEEIIIGYSALTEYYPSTMTLVYYNQQTGGYMPGHMSDYHDFLCSDFNNDGVAEILNVTYTGISAIRSTANCLVYDFNLNTFRALSGSAYLTNTDNCYRIERDETADGRAAVYITSKQGSMLKGTEILVWSGDALVPVNLSIDKSYEIGAGFLYYGSAIAQDIDGDGVVEYPVSDVTDESKISADIKNAVLSQSKEMLQYTCSWYYIEENSPVYDFSCYLNADLGYYIAIKNPSYYTDIAVYIDSSDNMLFYYVAENGQKELLFSVVASSSAPADKNTQLLHISQTDTYLSYIVNPQISAEAYQKLIPVGELKESITATGIITVS